MSKLALLGGLPARTKLFPAYNTMGEQEKRAAIEVIESGNLSQFLGAWHEDFYGGPKVRAFEGAWADSMGARYAMSVNSNTSGLFAAIGAVGIQPGDEVIVSPYTMSASAIAPLGYGGVPVFADIDEDIFCISPSAFRKAITSRTKAIVIVHIFGQAADMDEIMAIAREHKIAVIEDCAQVPGGTYKGKPLGAIGDLGVFSLNYHKHIHTGEGGVVTTNSEELLERLQLIRNHGENIAGPKGITNLLNTYGYNYRMPEIEAAIGIEQLKKLPSLIARRIELANEFTRRLGNLPGITPPKVRPGNKHVYYQHACRFDAEKNGISRDTFVKALKAELPSAVLRETTPILNAGYVKPLYLLPIFQQRTGACAFNCSRYEGKVSYDKGLCPTAERMHFKELFSHEYIRPGMEKQDVEDVMNGFEKIFENLPALKNWELTQQPSQ